MAKRFIDTDLFRKPFMRGLEAPYKALWIYLLCECDHAGVWVVELDVAQIRMGFKFDAQKAIEKMGGSIVEIDGGSKWYLPDFVAFQYGTLNPANRVHASVLERLSRLGVDPLKEVEKKGLVSPLQGAKDKEKDKDTLKEKGTRDEIEAQFEGLWITFERYGAKGKALAYWKQLSAEDRAVVVSKAPAYVASTPGCEYRKQLEGWINPVNRLWERPIVQRGSSEAAKRPMTKEEAREAINEIRRKRGIPPGGVVETHLIPEHIRQVLARA